MDRVSVTLGNFLNAHGLAGRLSEYRIIGKWEKTVGTVIARHAQPQLIRGKKLTLIVDSPAWMQQLSLLKQELIEKVNKSFGKEVIRSITLKLGEIAPAPVHREESSSHEKLSREDVAEMEAYLQGIRDSEIRRAVRDVMEKDFLNRKKNHKT